MKNRFDKNAGSDKLTGVSRNDTLAQFPKCCLTTIFFIQITECTNYNSVYEKADSRLISEISENGLEIFSTNTPAWLLG